MKLNIESEATPLGDDLLKARMQTHNFAKAFFHEIMLAADSIMNKEEDKLEYLNFCFGNDRLFRARSKFFPIFLRV